MKPGHSLMNIICWRKRAQWKESRSDRSSWPSMTEHVNEEENIEFAAVDITGKQWRSPRPVLCFVSARAPSAKFSESATPTRLKENVSVAEAAPKSKTSLVVTPSANQTYPKTIKVNLRKQAGRFRKARIHTEMTRGPVKPEEEKVATSLEAAH